MIPLLAQAAATTTAAPSDAIPTWAATVLVLVLLCTIGSCVAALYAAFSRRSQERTVTISPDAATKNDLQTHIAKTSTDVRDLHTKIERVEARINERIDKASREQELDMQEQTREINRSIEQMPERLIKMLRHTGAIGGNHE